MKLRDTSILIALAVTAGCSSYDPPRTNGPGYGYSAGSGFPQTPPPAPRPAPLVDRTSTQISDLQAENRRLQAQITELRGADRLAAAEIARLKSMVCELGKIASRLNFRKGSDGRYQALASPELSTPPAEYCT